MKMRIAVVALATAALLATSAAATAKPSAHKLGGVLKVVAWEGYTENQWVKPFEKQTGCTVQHQYAGSSDEMYNLMKKNAGYDLVSASGDASNRLIASGLVQPIDPSKIPNWKQLTPQLRRGANQYVGGKNYGVPWQWGPNVLMWNTAKYKGVTNSWSALYDPRNKGLITIPNNPIQIADAALYLSRTTPSLGIRDPYELTSKQLDAAVALLKKQRPLIKSYWGFATDEVKNFQTGGATLGAAWPLAVAQLQRAGMKVAQSLPKEGATGWSDVWMLAKNPKNPDCAQAWLKYSAGAKVQAQVAKFNTYTPANLLSCKALGKKLCAALHADGDSAYLNRVKFWKTPLSDCGNGKTDCTPYSTWVAKWTSIKG
jgi:putative spermidine/putrescine transport system substrate-binding protein